MRVAMITGTYTGGGIGVIVDAVVGELLKLGLDVDIVTKNSLKPAPFRNVGLKIITPHSRKALRLLKKYDIVHVMGGSTLVVPALLSKKPTVFTFQGQSPPALHGGPIKNAKAYAIELLYKATMGKFDVVTCAAKFGQEDIRSRYGVSKSVWIPNGVDRKIFYKAKSHEIDAIKKKYGSPLFIGVGNLYPVKGWEEMLDWFEAYLKNGNRGNLIIAGEGILLKPLRQRIDRSLLKGRVHLLGNVPYDQLYKYYNASDAYISGSPYEGFCLPAIEALACGKPLLVRKRGAMIEHALNSGCGAIFEDSISFQHAAKKVLAMQPTDVERKAEIYLEPFTWRNAAEQYIKIYKKLVN